MGLSSSAGGLPSGRPELHSFVSMPIHFLWFIRAISLFHGVG